MNKFLIKSLAVLMMTVIFSTTSLARPVKRIKFPKGATEVIVTGQLNGFKDSQTYLINLRANQTFKIEDISESYQVTLAVYDAKGNSVDDYDLSCHGNFELPKTKAGDYKIVVTECLKADPWKGTFKIKVSAVNN